MLKQSIKILFRPKGLLFQIIVGCAVGLIIGVSIKWIPPLLILGFLAAALLIFAMLKRPEIALVGILVATSSIVFEDQLPLFSAGGMSLHLTDFVLIGMLGIIIVRWLVEPGFKIVRTSLDWPLIIFIGVTLLSTFIALSHSSVDPVEARRWIRVLSYYLTFFIVTNLVRDRRQLNFLLNGLFILATIVAAAMVAQFLLGDTIQLLPGRVEALNTQGTVFEDITRILPPGWSIVLVSFVTLLCILVLEKPKPFGWLKFFPLGILGLALLVTFLRSYWAVLILVIILLGYLLRGVEREKLIKWGLLVISLAIIILLFIFSNPGSRAAKLVDASLTRLSTLGDSGTFQGQDSSLNWRMLENEYALTSIVAHPLIGSGMGFTYRPWDSRLDVPGNSFDFRKFIHNGYFWILLQSGMLGLLSFMWLSFSFLLRGFKYWRKISTPRLRGVVLGFTLVYLAVIIAAVVNSTFMQWRWTPVIGILMGLNEVILIKFRQEELVH
jgi:O-antigen ligase